MRRLIDVTVSRTSVMAAATKSYKREWLAPSGFGPAWCGKLEKGNCPRGYAHALL